MRRIAYTEGRQRDKAYFHGIPCKNKTPSELPLRGGSCVSAYCPCTSGCQATCRDSMLLLPLQRRRPPPAAETGRSCWSRGLQDASAAQGTKQTQGAAIRTGCQKGRSASITQALTQYNKKRQRTIIPYPLPLFCFSSPAPPFLLTKTRLAIIIM